jgi:hypothetical protein
MLDLPCTQLCLCGVHSLPQLPGSHCEHVSMGEQNSSPLGLAHDGHIRQTPGLQGLRGPPPSLADGTNVTGPQSPARCRSSDLDRILDHQVQAVACISVHAAAL